MIILDHPIDLLFDHGSLGIKAGLAAKVFNAIQSLGFKAGDPENIFIYDACTHIKY